MTSDSTEKPPAGSPWRERTMSTVVYASRRFHSNKLSCFLVTLVFVLVGCIVVMPPMLKETSSQMLDSYRASSSELIARIREMVTAENVARLGEVEQEARVRKEVRAELKGKEGKNKGKWKKGKMKKDFTDKDDENENGEDEDYGSISTKINKKGKKKIRNNFRAKENDGKKVWEENSKGVEQHKNKPNQGKDDGRKFLKKKNIYIQDVPFKLSDNWTAADTEQASHLMAGRADKMRRACKDLQGQDNYTELPLQRLLASLRWVTEHEMVWCPIFKAASTTWVKNLLELADARMKDHRFHSKTKELYPMPKNPDVVESFLEKAMKLIIVRHPLDRILSAYRDKMRRTLRNGKIDNFKEIQENIFQKFKDPELPDGVDDSNIRPASDHVPTFNQFLLSVKEDVETYWNLKGKHRINLHWRPYWATCSPCAFQYSTIAKVETLPKDQEFIIRDRGLEETLLYAQSHSSKFDSFNSTREATVAYFSCVPRSLLEAIVNLFRPDFALFDYSPDYHLSLAIKGI